MLNPTSSFIFSGSGGGAVAGQARAAAGGCRRARGGRRGQPAAAVGREKLGEREEVRFGVKSKVVICLHESQILEVGR